MSCRRQIITLENQLMTFHLFVSNLLRHQHCAKHFLSLQESWHALENVSASAHDILTWRRDIALLNCKCEDHSEQVCVNFLQCDAHLEKRSETYCAKIADILCEISENGAAAWLDNHKKQLLCLSSDGVIVIAAVMNHRQWNIRTAYVAYDIRIETPTEATVFERFFTALDQARWILTRDIQRANQHRYVNPDIWHSFFNMEQTYGDSNERI